MGEWESEGGGERERGRGERGREEGSEGGGREGGEREGVREWGREKKCLIKAETYIFGRVKTQYTHSNLPLRHILSIHTTHRGRLICI